MSLLLTTGLWTAVGSPFSDSGVEAAETAKPELAQSLADGTYLYGQSPEPDQIGSEYLVFEVNQGQVVGGFYMPRSSFDCFHGSLESNQMALTVVDSYEQTPHAYSVALRPNGTNASAGSSTVPMGLEGYHRLDEISNTDQEILATCKADQNR